MTQLANNMKTIFPLFPNPPDLEFMKISNALDAALVAHVQNVFVPAGFGATLLGAMASPSPFMVLLSNYLESILSPILTSALSLENNPSSPLPHLLAWANIQPSFDALILSVPPFMAGLQGAIFWQAIILTIRFFIVPAEIPIPEESSTGIGEVTLENSL